MSIDYLGTSLKYPLEISNGLPSLVSGTENVQQSIKLALMTKKGQRFFNPDYGSNIHKLQFMPNDDVLGAMLELEIEQTIADWVKQVQFLSVSFKIDDDKVFCSIKYKNLLNGQFEGFIYPFYKIILS